MAQTDFTIADVLAWARTKPADEAYTYTDNNNCALCQFLRETGRANKPEVEPGDALDADGFIDDEGYWRDAGQEHRYPRILEAPLSNRHERWDARGHTFGKLVKRLEALCPEIPVTKSDWLAIDAYLADIEQASA